MELWRGFFEEQPKTKAKNAPCFRRNEIAPLRQRGAAHEFYGQEACSIDRIFIFYVDHRVTGFQTKRHLFALSPEPRKRTKSCQVRTYLVAFRRWIDDGWTQLTQHRYKNHMVRSLWDTYTLYHNTGRSVPTGLSLGAAGLSNRLLVAANETAAVNERCLL